MRRRVAVWLPWGIFLATVGLILVAYRLGGLSAAEGVGEHQLTDLLWASTWLGLPAVGALIASRRPENPVGWLACTFGLPVALTLAGSAYGRYAIVVREGGLPGGTAAFWVSEWLFYVTGVLVVFTFLLFPDGRLPSRRWRPAALLAVALGAAGALSEMFGPFPLNEIPVANPIGIPGFGPPMTEAVQNAAGWGIALLVPVSLLSTFFRMRRASHEQRLQLKWFFYGLCLFVALIAFDFSLEAFFEIRPPDILQILVFFVAGMAPPAGMAVGILRYRLFDIDVIVNKTLVYGALTAMLGGGYFAFVVLLQQLTRPLTRGSDLAIAGSTLTVAALFGPARRRIQAFVDRRFYRRRYDAAKTLEAFSARLRREIDLDSLGSELSAVVEQTVQPRSVSLWMAPGASR